MTDAQMIVAAPPAWAGEPSLTPDQLRSLRRMIKFVRMFARYGAHHGDGSPLRYDHYSNHPEDFIEDAEDEVAELLRQFPEVAP